MEAGIERIRCSAMRASAVYWLSIIPEYIPAPAVRKAGSPTESAGLVRRLSRRSESTQTMVTAAPTMSIGSDTGVPWKLAPVRVTEPSVRKMGLSPTPLSSVSTWRAANATASRAVPMTCGEERIE
jgi:hypothetical protein